MSSVASSALEIAGRVGLQPPTLDTPVKESAFLSLASFADPWRLVFFELLAPTDISDVDAENVGRSEQEKRVACLRKWKSRYGAEATYRVIVQSALKCGRVDNAEGICRQLLQESQSPVPPSHSDSGFPAVPPPHSDSGSPAVPPPHSDSGSPAVPPPHSDSRDGSVDSEENKDATGNPLPQSTPTPRSPVCTVGEQSCDLEVQIDRLDQQYIEIETVVLRTIKIREIPLDEVLNWIRFPPTSLRTQFADFLRSQAKLLFSSTTVDELFAIVSSYWNLFHPALLQHLVNKLGDQGIKSRMDRYMDNLYHFRIQTALGDFLDKWVGEIPPGYQEFVLELGEEWREKTVEEFEQFRIRLSRLQSFGGGHMSFMKTAKSSSILVVLALPEVLFPINLRQTVVHSFLRDENIVRVMVDGQCVLDLEKLTECESRLLALCRDNTGDIKEFTYILSQPGVDPNIYYEDGWTPLGLTCFDGRSDIADVLIKHGAKVDLPTNDDIGESPLITASIHGHVALCKLLIKRGATVDNQTKEGGTALYTASQRGQKEVVELLLNSGASVDKPNMDAGCTALRVASANGRTDVACVLIARGASLDHQDEEGGTPLYMATQFGHKEVAQLLLHSGAQPDIPNNEDSSTPLMMATNAGNEDIAKLLVHHGAAVNYQDEAGWSPLHFASAYGHSSLVELLVKSGAELDIQTKDGMTALAWAAYNGHKKIVDILLNSRAIPDVLDQKGLTPLMLATQCGHKEVIKVLVERKANPNITEVNTGWTALYFAAEVGDVETLRILLEGGANVEIKDKNGLTAHDIASINSQPAVCQLLEQYGYRPSQPVPAPLQLSGRRDPITSIQTFRNVLEHGSKMPDIPPKHQASHNAPGEHSDEAV